jgi:hypothetical protein
MSLNYLDNVFSAPGTDNFSALQTYNQAQQTSNPTTPPPPPGETLQITESGRFADFKQAETPTYESISDYAEKAEDVYKEAQKEKEQKTYREKYWPYELKTDAPGNFLSRFQAVWGLPDIEYDLWPDWEKQQFVTYYLTHAEPDPDESPVLYKSDVTDNPEIRYDKDIKFPFNFKMFDSSIKETIELEDDKNGEDRDKLRNLLAGLIGAKSHTADYFFLNYNPHILAHYHYGQRLDFIRLLKKHYPRFRFYVDVLQAQIIEPYWRLRTDQENKNRWITAAIIVGGVLLGAITGGLAGAAAGGISTSLKTFFNIDVNAKDIEKGLEGIGDLNFSGVVDDINLDPSELIDKLGDINLDPAALYDKIKNFDPTIDINLLPENILKSFVDAAGNIDYNAVRTWLENHAPGQTNNDWQLGGDESDKQEEKTGKTATISPTLKAGLASLILGLVGVKK